MIRFANLVDEILAADTSDFYERDPETFFASQIGFCPRQLYLSKLGLTADDQRRGQYKTTQLLQAYLTEQINNRLPRVETDVSLQIADGPVTFIGRCTLYDPEAEVVYAVKARNGWYKFSPPVERHLDQLHIYMRGLGVKQGRLLYVSKNDLGEIREWPPRDEHPPYVVFDQDRYDQLVAKANRIRETIWAEGIATAPEAIPFQRCGCYFCQEEQLAFPDETAPVPTATSDDTSSLDSSDQGAPAEQSSYTESPSLEHDNPGNLTPSAESDPSTIPPDSSTVVESDGVHIPQTLRSLAVWVVWDGRSKIPLAPWQEGTMYPCEWAKSKDLDPRRSFEKAHMVAELPIHAIHEAWPFPDEEALPDWVKPAVLLPHEPSTPPLTVIDLDDVRNPETGRVPNEVTDIITRLNGYTEVSASGTGIHIFVRAGLPDDVGAFTAPLSTRGTIEIYDHSRFIGGTWRHVDGTPTDAVPENQDTLSTLVEEYGTDQSQQERGISR